MKVVAVPSNASILDRSGRVMNDLAFTDDKCSCYYLMTSSTLISPESNKYVLVCFGGMLQCL